MSGVATSNESDIKVVTEKELVTLLELIHTFSSQWDIIGMVLGFAPSELDKIKNMSSLFKSAPTGWLKELLSQWVQWPTLSHPTKPTMTALCTSLRSSLVDLGSIVDKMEMEMKMSLTTLCKE